MMFTKQLLNWYKQYGRDLPWRQTLDPYAIMVSEFMLQQTQVPRVIPKYQAFLKAFPTIQDLAAAPLSKVLQLWSGLGYYRRAKFLWEASKQIVKKHNGNVPQSQDELASLPGFGSYTSAAVLAFAYNKPVIVIDANVKNVFNKVFGLTEKEIPGQIAQYLPKDKARDFYNALMDIGSVYYNSNSDYTNYPFKDFCFWYNKKNIPVLKKIQQKSFKNSNRFYRGQILKMLASGQQVLTQSFDTKYKIALEQLQKEQLVVCENGKLYLPN